MSTNRNSQFSNSIECAFAARILPKKVKTSTLKGWPWRVESAFDCGYKLGPSRIVIITDTNETPSNMSAQPDTPKPRRDYLRTPSGSRRSVFQLPNYVTTANCGKRVNRLIGTSRLTGQRPSALSKNVDNGASRKLSNLAPTFSAGARKRNYFINSFIYAYTFYEELLYTDTHTLHTRI